jgi:hypothetical protein
MHLEGEGRRVNSHAVLRRYGCRFDPGLRLADTPIRWGITPSKRTGCPVIGTGRSSSGSPTEAGVADRVTPAGLFSPSEGTAPDLAVA